MKRILFILTISLITAITTLGQNFEGKVIYAGSYESKNPQVDSKQLSTIMGTEMEYLVKGEKYKSICNGGLLQWQLYNNKDYKLYTKNSNSEIVYWNDVRVNNDEILSVEINKKVTKVLGQKCDEIIFICKSGVQKYYYSSKFSIDSKLYANHLFGNYYDYMSIANAIPLKSVVETDQFIFTGVAKKVKRMKLDDKEFELPPDAKIQNRPIN